MYFDWIQNFKVNFISLTPITQTSCCSTTRRACASAEITATVGGVYCSWIIMVIRSMCAVFIHSWMQLQNFRVNKSPKVSLWWYKGRRNMQRLSDCEDGLQQTQILGHNFRTVLLRRGASVSNSHHVSPWLNRQEALPVNHDMLVPFNWLKKKSLSVLWVRLSFKNIL